MRIPDAVLDEVREPGFAIVEGFLSAAEVQGAVIYRRRASTM